MHEKNDNVKSGKKILELKIYSLYSIHYHSAILARCVCYYVSVARFEAARLPDKTNLELMQLVRESASIFTSPTNQLGYGIPNFESLLLTLAQPENFKEEVQIYPNPVTNGIVNIQADIEIKSYNVNIYDVMGKMVLRSSNINANRIELSESGMYYISISDDSGSVLATRKVVVQ